MVLFEDKYRFDLSRVQPEQTQCVDRNLLNCQSKHDDVDEDFWSQKSSPAQVNFPHLLQVTRRHMMVGEENCDKSGCYVSCLSANVNNSSLLS
jgi:hypothetical protein